MQVQVLYADRDGSYDHVANINFQHLSPNDPVDIKEGLELSFQYTQNIMGSWSRGPRIEIEGKFQQNPDWYSNVEVVKPLEIYNGQEYGHRSSMVGDRMLVDGKIYEVATFGFNEVES